VNYNLSGIGFLLRGAMFIVKPAYALLIRVYKEVEGNSRRVVKKAYPIKVSYSVMPLL
jgi:hypothetical protein